jgi:hypothetical protein
VSVPPHVRSAVRDYLWQEADRINWNSLSAAEKARYYANWTVSDAVGARLSPYLDPRKVRVYIKDTLLKPYARDRMRQQIPRMQRIGLLPQDAPVQEFIKPHGQLFADGRIVVWSKAVDWKLALMAAFERAHSIPGARPYGVALFDASTKHADTDARSIAESAAKLLGVEKLVWLD